MGLVYEKNAFAALAPRDFFVSYPYPVGYGAEMAS